VLINGVIWAKYNVAEPGVFAASPADNGMLYQFNRRVGWSATNPMTSSPPGEDWLVYGANLLEWEAKNDPCPAGWHVPSETDAQSLAYTVEAFNYIGSETWVCYGYADKASLTPSDALCFGTSAKYREQCTMGYGTATSSLHDEYEDCIPLNKGVVTCEGYPGVKVGPRTASRTGYYWSINENRTMVHAIRCVHD
jgi:hypothetical protein